jgi:fumarate hydratase subunit alpha
VTVDTTNCVREIEVGVLGETVARLLVECNYKIPGDVLEALRRAVEKEESPLGRQTLEQLVQNYEVAAAERRPVCQDSGLTVVMLEVGQDVHWIGGDLHDAIHEGVRKGTETGYLRWSVTGDPTRRLRTLGSDSPCVVHVTLVSGNTVRLTLASKGFGAENMSTLRMLVPADGVDGIRAVVLETVDRAGANACPPIIVGVGIGGAFETAPMLAKKAVLRPLTERNARPDIRALEADWLDAVNGLGIGPQGFGGVITALAVNIEVHSTHIAGLPVAVNLGCHSTRRMSAVL